MKKFIALLLLMSAVLTFSSCEGISLGSGYEEPKPVKPILLTNNMSTSLVVDAPEDTPPLESFLQFPFSSSLISTDSLKINEKSIIFESDDGIDMYVILTDDKDEFKEYFEIVSGLVYEDYYNSDFFDNYFIVILSGLQNMLSPVYNFEYTFDKESSVLDLQLYELPYIQTDEMVSANTHLVPINKNDVVNNEGKVSIEEISIVLTYIDYEVKK